MDNIQGFLVTSDISGEESRYDGVAKYSAWPLTECNSDKAQALSDYQFNNWLYTSNSNLMLVRDECFLFQYVVQCNAEGISSRLFWLTTARGNTITAPPMFVKSWDFLGWDYLSSVDASYLFDDGDTLFKLCPEELACVKKRMTKYGLFGSSFDAEYYAIMRKNNKYRVDIEHIDDEYIVAVFCLSL